ncbi:shikimate dehydrogenase [Aureimonas phyllosphaerae]|uniref:Shikimate dehydrogenase (NADP(+)) n=1 Tax=Aureimonas phyllosphaerae TaxID=1166078 RepID=A0A7W6FVR2_9HYPH|nr:shikimate dehydrogenase [Aureimonas phyllosphaerae]MBB3936302.1 shikimate dehydrogenase [Aureimonas phyllosphaerae]MBB3959973.1 shikimate dehydrogenase [Aureimonas phyllosphaerae]SFF47878.1 shikimate dehydrogenase [Aureimonas phyllosphaerae]
MREAPRAFVTGWPISHSRSPLIHGTWLRDLRIPGSYERIAVPPEDFPAFLGRLQDEGFAGGNVTIPHKEAAFAAAARLDGAAEAIGAVNTLWFEDGRLTGGNTDAYGFSANLDERLGGWREARAAVVLGAGGAARAVVHALREAEIARITILNRTRARAERLADAFGAEAGAEDDFCALAGSCDLVVNTRPADPKGLAEGDARAIEALPDGALVTDIVYVPLETPILRAAAARGLRTADGLGMLLHQAVPGFERWFGQRPTVDEALRAAVIADIEAHA